MAGNSINQQLLLQISANSAELKAALSKAGSEVQAFKKQIDTIKSAIGAAFTVTAILGAAKAVFDFANEIDGIIGKIDDLGASLDLATDAGKVKAIADTFEMEVDPIIKAANATATQFGISFGEALTYIQQGLALAGTDSAKFLKSLEAQAANFNALGGQADEYFAIVVNGYRNSTNWEKELAAGRSDSIKQFSELTNQFNDGQIIQQDLINSSAELNKVWASTFDGTGDLVDSLHIGFNNLAIGAIKGLKDIANWFIELYNNSMMFRGVIQAVVLNFKMLWETIKLVFKNFFNILSTAGDLIKAVFTLNFDEIPGILKNAFNEAATGIKDYAVNTAENFKTAYENTVNAKPIELFKDSEAQAQGAKAAKSFATGFNKEAIISDSTHKEFGSVNKTSLTDAVKPVTVDTSKALEGLTLQQTATDTLANSQLRLNELTMQYGEYTSTAAGIVSDSLVTMFDGILTGNKESSKSFKEAGKVFKETAKSMIAGALAQAISQAILKSMSTAKNPIVGLVLAGLATAGVMALFSAIPAFQTGVRNTNSPLFIAGESGGRGELIANTGNGSRVYNHGQTMSMLRQSQQKVIVEGRISGETIRLTTAENNRRLDNSR